MSDRDQDLERLISRYLDDESDARERRALRHALRREPRMEALFEEASALDREVGIAIRKALGRSAGRCRRVLPPWNGLGRLVAVGLAACLALAFLAWPARPPATTARYAGQGISGPGSWFAPPPAMRDAYEAAPVSLDRPRLRLDRADRNWIVVPGDRPGEYLVVEIKRVHSRSFVIQGDF